MKEILISAKNITKTYFSKAEALCVLDNTSFSIFKGESVCLLGASGSGKTTTLNLLAGIDKPTDGKIFYENEDIHSWGRTKLYEYRLSKLGFIFQSFHLQEHMNALENVMSPYILQGKTEYKAKNHALKLLDRVGIKNKAMSFPDQLSSGQKQRVAVARSIAKYPPPAFLIADEPTGTLDSETGDQVMKLIQSIVQENLLTMIFTTHEAHVAKLADRILFLHKGKISEIDESKLEIFDTVYI